MELFEAVVVALQKAIMLVGGALLAVLAAVAFLTLALPAVWREVRRFLSLGAVEKVLCGVFVVALVHYGATKHIYYDGGIKAGATANVVTNDTVSIYWQRDTSGGVYIPESAAVYIDYRPSTATNEEWGLLAQTTVGAWGWSGTVQNATNYDYQVWAYYIPPEPVHTNGVWTYKTHFDRNSDFVIPLRARIEVDGRAIATPKEVRKDAEDD